MKKARGVGGHGNVIVPIPLLWSIKLIKLAGTDLAGLRHYREGEGVTD